MLWYFIILEFSIWNKKAGRIKNSIGSEVWCLKQNKLKILKKEEKAIKSNKG